MQRSPLGTHRIDRMALDIGYRFLHSRATALDGVMLAYAPHAGMDQAHADDASGNYPLLGAFCHARSCQATQIPHQAPIIDPYRSPPSGEGHPSV
jgi:hypothetical protein